VLKQATKSDDVLDCLRYGAKSMLNPRKTPLAVEAREKWADMEREGRSLTERSIVMLKMQDKKRSRKSAWAVR
jgi:hypothetical protein